ncbi:MAG: type III pantothenate kinase [Nitrospirae bacterium]|nr:type III pantothenate kinase [Nitrospirota bacterium]
MLLTIDVGNTNTVLGVFENANLLDHWRIGTGRGSTADEYGVLTLNLLERKAIDPKAIRHVIISCVVPPVLPSMEWMSEKYFGVKPLVVGPGIKTGMAVLYDNPREVGADRIVNAVAAFDRFRCECIVVDFGTATTFDCISRRGEYMGGVIVPGIGISLEALVARASKLPGVEIARPERVIGKTTIQSIQSGVYYGYLGLVEEMVRRLKKEMGQNARVIGTGGYGNLISQDATCIEEMDELLTLKGLRLLFERNHAPAGA